MIIFDQLINLFFDGYDVAAIRWSSWWWGWYRESLSRMRLMRVMFIGRQAIAWLHWFERSGVNERELIVTPVQSLSRECLTPSGPRIQVGVTRFCKFVHTFVHGNMIICSYNTKTKRSARPNGSGFSIDLLSEAIEFRHVFVGCMIDRSIQEWDTKTKLTVTEAHQARWRVDECWHDHRP